MRNVFRTWSLGTRMIALFSGLLAGIGTFMLAYFPAEMADQARTSTEQRAASIAQVMSTALGPALEFDDADNAAAILGWLASAQDARFGVVLAADGRKFATWRPTAIPNTQTWPATFHIESSGGLLVVSTPIRTQGEGRGSLHLGFSLEALAHQRATTQRAVGVATGAVLVIGVLATMLLAAFVVRPIRTLTRRAQQISRGELPPQLPAVAGTDEISRLATALRAMLERVNEVSQQELVLASRHAGMAEVATGVLHNVGNVLTSINVTVEVLHEHATAMPVDRLRRLHDLLAAPAGVLEGDRLAAAVKYMSVVTEALEGARAAALRDLDVLAGHVEHVKRVVAMQNAYARVRSVVESTRLQTLLDDAVEMACPPQRYPNIVVSKHLSATLAPVVMIDRHRVLQILVNLISNARDAVIEGTGERRITVHAEDIAEGLQIRVIDSGVGIGTEQRARIFSAGFTSKPKGHGYGLHSAVLAARHMGGDLTLASEGVGRGATFTLTVPLAGQKWSEPANAGERGPDT